MSEAVFSDFFSFIKASENRANVQNTSGLSSNAVSRKDKKNSEAAESEWVSTIAQSSVAWALTQGMCFIRPGGSLLNTRLSSFSLFPTPFPRQAFQKAVHLSPIFTMLVTQLTLHPEWLLNALKSVAESDPQFTQHLWQIAYKCYLSKEHPRAIDKDILLIITRSDYMLNNAENQDGKAASANQNDVESQSSCLQQVEINTISVSFAAFAQHLVDIHRVLVSGDLQDTKIFGGPHCFCALLCRHNVAKYCRATLASQKLENCCPTNQSGASIVEAMRDADELYRARLPGSSQELSEIAVQLAGTCVLFVVDKMELNELDQRHVEIGLNRCGLHVIRVSFEALYALWEQGGLRMLVDGKLREKPDNSRSGRLFIQELLAFFEVSVVYYRTGYDPAHYGPKPDQAWQMRELLELSDAVKCPNVLTHLAGVKKIQMLLCSDTRLAKFLPDEHQRRCVLSTCVDQVDPDEYYTDEYARLLVDEALENPYGFVLKPQREGGLNNLHGKDLVSALRTLRDGATPISVASRSKMLCAPLAGTRPTEADSEAHTDVKESMAGAIPCCILMRKISSAPQPSAIVSFDGSKKEGCHSGSMPITPTLLPSCVSELGTFGIGLMDSSKTVYCRHGGHLLRTKDSKNFHGGVATGIAFLDTPFLTS